MPTVKTFYKQDILGTIYDRPGKQRTKTITQAVEGGGELELDITTTATVIDFGDGAPGIIHIVNYDDTNYVTFGAGVTGVIAPLGKLSANGGDAHLELLSGAVLMLQANTATCRVRIEYANA